MFRKTSVPMFALVSAFSVSLVITGCGGDGGGGGTGGKGTGGSASGGATGSGGAASGGATGSGGAASGGAGGSATGGAAAGGTSGAAGGAAGAAGGAAGGGGRGGGSTGGAAGGAAGGGGRGGGSTGGAAGSAGGAGGGGGSGPTANEVKAMCSMAMYGTDSGTGKFTPAEFCALYLSTCTAPAADYNTMEKCLDRWAMVTTNAHCRTYHLCNAAVAGPATTHCPHAVGMQACMGN